MNQPRLLIELCSIPTAPFAEHLVTAYVKKFVAQRKRLRLKADSFGNLLIELKRKKRAPVKSRWIFSAHMDHPGFVAREMIDRHTVRADFRGGVYADFMKQTRVRFFDGDREVVGKVIELDCGDDSRSAMPTSARIRVSGSVPPGTIGMFDQGGGRIRGKNFYSRVCDDLAGAASCLTMLDELLKNPPGVEVAVLLTRGRKRDSSGRSPLRSAHNFFENQIG